MEYSRVSDPSDKNDSDQQQLGALAPDDVARDAAQGAELVERWHREAEAVRPRAERMRRQAQKARRQARVAAPCRAAPQG